jgi:hypothetical protein
MAAGDYAEGQPVRQAPRKSQPGDHPTRDLLLAAVVGAAALWAVPKALDYVSDLVAGGDELELDEE